MASAMNAEKSWIFVSNLGSGGFGVVQLWRNARTGEEIAIKKCLSTEDQLTDKQKERWISELSTMEYLRHPNIIGTKQIPNEIKNVSSSLPVLCMEYCSLGDLRCVLSKSENWCGLPEPNVIQIMSNIAGAVEYLHAHKITHRDLKPENVVLQPMNDKKIIYKLIDLGYAKTLGHDSMCASIVGTLNYVAPELLMQQKYSCSVDYWSLGILFYEIITGLRPFLSNESNPVIILKKYIEKKSYQDICGEDIDGRMVFHKTIQHPNDMTPCIRDALVDWFRIVLQWDSKKRGRQRQGNGIGDVVVFKMLRQILIKKVVHVFCVSRYKIYDYEIADNTTLAILQSWIENDTGIPVSSQELIINSSGALLKDGDVLRDTRLTLFRKENVVVEYSEPNIPARIEKMIDTPKTQLNKYELRQCYSAAIFFFKKEVELFRCYIMALSMKIDLIISRFDRLLLKNDEITKGLSLLKSEFDSMIKLTNDDLTNTNDNWQTEVQTVKEKIDPLRQIASMLKANCDQFLRARATLTEFGDVDWMTEYEKFFNDAQDIAEINRDLSLRDTRQPIRMTKLIVEFLKFRQSNMGSPKLAQIHGKINQIVKVLLKQETYVKSIIETISIYRLDISNLSKKWLNHKEIASFNSAAKNMDIECGDNVNPSSFSAPSNMEITLVDSDDVIRDNLVIRYMMHDIIHETHHKILKMIDLN